MSLKMQQTTKPDSQRSTKKTALASPKVANTETDRVQGCMRNLLEKHPSLAATALSGSLLLAGCGGKVMTQECDCAPCTEEPCECPEQEQTIDVEEDSYENPDENFPYSFTLTNNGPNTVKLAAMHMDISPQPIYDINLTFPEDQQCTQFHDSYSVIHCNDANLIIPPGEKLKYRFDASGSWNTIRIIGLYFETPNNDGKFTSESQVYTDLADEQIVFFQ